LGWLVGRPAAANELFRELSEFETLVSEVETPPSEVEIPVPRAPRVAGPRRPDQPGPAKRRPERLRPLQQSRINLDLNPLPTA
jgi:hypothetical protein